MHDYLTERGLRSDSAISLVMPLGTPIPPSPPASQALLTAFAERGIGWHPDRLVDKLDPDRKVAVLSDGTEMPYDLFLGVPRHTVPPVVEESGLAVDGWVPVNSLTLETEFPDVYAVGDVASVGTPKAGVFVKIIGLSVDPVDNHAEWAADIEETQGQALNYPVIGDGDFHASKLYGMLPAATAGDPEQRTPADNQTVRNVFVIGPDKKIKLILVYPMTTGCLHFGESERERSFDREPAR
jgi:hypothetical protein